MTSDAKPETRVTDPDLAGDGTGDGAGDPVVGRDRSAGDVVVDTIHRHLDAFSTAEVAVARAVLANYPTLLLRSSAEIAAESGTSAATVTRFAQRLGHSGLPSLQRLLLDEQGQTPADPFSTFQPVLNQRVSSTAEVLLALTDEGLRAQPAERFDEARELILGARRILVHGGRFSLGVAHTAYAHLNLLRPGVTLLAPAYTPIEDQLGMTHRSDLAIVFDFCRYSAEAYRIARHVAARRGSVLLVTDPQLSPAVEFADVTFALPVKGAGLADSYLPAAALVDLLVSDLMAHATPAMRERIRLVEQIRHDFAED